MRFTETPLPGAYIIDPEPFRDSRGLFARIFCLEELQAKGLCGQIVQMNHSVTVDRGTVRGMHYQLPPWSEVKMVKCIRGAVFDAVIDIRKGSPTFLKWHAQTLSAENMRTLYIPQGFAHGFQTLEPQSELLYLHSTFYHPEAEGGIRYSDPRIGIAWPLAATVVSERDRSYPLIDEHYQGLLL